MWGSDLEELSAVGFHESSAGHRHKGRSSRYLGEVHRVAGVERYESEY